MGGLEAPRRPPRIGGGSGNPGAEKNQLFLGGRLGQDEDVRVLHYRFPEPARPIGSQAKAFVGQAEGMIGDTLSVERIVSFIQNDPMGSPRRRRSCGSARGRTL